MNGREIGYVDNDVSICHASHDGKTPYVSVCVFLKSYENLKDECARDVRASAGAVITGPFVKWFE